MKRKVVALIATLALATGLAATTAASADAESHTKQVQAARVNGV